MAFPPPALKALATELAALLIQRKETLSIVETATGGLMSATLLSIPGTSACYKGGVNAYSLPARKAFLGWTDADTAGYAGPTESIVLHLALSLRSALSTTYALSESGVAGPSRPTVYREEIDGPGYCPFAVVGEGVERCWTVRVEQGEGRERGENMVAFAEEGLRGLLEVVRGREGKL